MFIHKPIKFLIIGHYLNWIIKNFVYIHILCCNFPLPFFLCYLIHSIITNGFSINIKLAHILIIKIAGRIKLIQVQHNLGFWQTSINSTLPLYHNCLRYILICQNIIFFFIINHSKIMIKSPYQARVFIRQCTIKRLLIIKQCAILPILQQKHTRNTSHWIYLSTFSF